MCPNCSNKIYKNQYQTNRKAVESTEDKALQIQKIRLQLTQKLGKWVVYKRLN